MWFDGYRWNRRPQNRCWLRYRLFPPPHLLILHPLLATSAAPSPLQYPLSDDEAGSAKWNFKPNCQSEGGWRAGTGSGKMLRSAKEEERRLPLSPFLVSGSWSAANPAVFYCVAAREEMVHACHEWCNAAMSSPLCFYPARIMIMMMTMRGEKRKVHLNLGSTARHLDWCIGGMRLPSPACIRRKIEGMGAYLVIVVVCQALAVESHPAPLKNAIPAKGEGKGRCKINPLEMREISRASRWNNTQTERHLTKFTPEQVLIFHQEHPPVRFVKSRTNSCQLV